MSCRPRRFAATAPERGEAMDVQQTSQPKSARRDAGRDRAEALDRLHREMTALFGIMPAAFAAHAAEVATDAEIEAQFDNMPV